MQRVAAALIAHRRRVLAMPDEEILAVMADGISGDDSERAALAKRTRDYSARSPAHAAQVFRAGRWATSKVEAPETAANG